MLKTITLFLLSLTIAYAETSVFSTQGPGDFYSSKSSFSGLAENDSLTANPANFAAWAGLENTYFNLSFDYINHDVKDNFGSASSYDDISISGFNFALPFGEKHVFGISLSPFSVVNIQNTFPKTYIENDTAIHNPELISITGQEKRKGSFNNLSLIYGKAFKNLSFSTDVSFIFGSINENVMKIYKSEQSSSEATIAGSRIIENNFQTSAFVINPGLSTIYKWNQFAFAGKISIPIYSKFEKNNTYLNNTSKENSTINNADWPISFGLGSSWQPEKWKISGDFLFTGFDGLKMGLAENEEYVNYWKLSLSAKYHHSSRLLAPYYQKLTYKAGLSIEQRPVTLITSRVYDYTAFGSIITPFAGNRASVETNFSYTLSGDKKLNGFEDQVWRVGFTFHNSNSWWLRKSRYDD